MGSGQNSVLIWLAALAGVVVTLFALEPSRRGSTPATPTCPAGTEPMLRIELIFGMARRDRPNVTEDDWRAFLADVVTPRFPSGLTVLDGNGQWRNETGAIIREPSKALLVYARPDAGVDAALAEIRKRWRETHEQESVLLAVAASCVGFYAVPPDPPAGGLKG